jgi:predicted metal-dependent hydrolase
VSANFTIRRSQRARRARVTLNEIGAVIVVLPTRAAEREAGELVERHRRWITNHQRRIGEAQRILAARPAIGEGRTISLRGLPHEVVAERDASGRRYSSVEVEVHSPPSIVVRQAPTDPRHITDVLQNWLRREARRDLERQVALRAAEMKLQPRRISVRDQRSRWGSASRRGTLSFSWRLVLCPPDILDYVVVHELAHLRWAGHGARFWALVHRHAPAADHYRRWLRANESRLRNALD